MKNVYTLFFLSIITTMYAHSWYTSTQILQKYKPFLTKHTYDNQAWPEDKKPKSRYDTFKRAFEEFEKIHGTTVVELGTTRSFVHGGLPGCNSNDAIHWTPDNPERWDWGAGCFTRVACECLVHLNPIIHTVDIASEHIYRCKIITQEFKNILTYHTTSSEQFLNTCNISIDLLYLDTGDMTPIEPTAQLHLREAKIIVARNLIKPGGLILIDDVRNQTPKKFGETSDYGKAKYSLPYFLEHGFELIEDEYQVLLRKK